MSDSLRECCEAIETLERDDPRLESVIEQLAASTDPQARRALVTGALRFFDHLDALVDKRRAPAPEWPTLAEMFRADDYLLRALLHAMEPRRDLDDDQMDEVEMLARTTLAHGSDLAVLDIAWARAMQVVATYELDDLVYLALGYITSQHDLDASVARLGDASVLNLAESARTLAARQPAAAREALRPFLDETDRPPALRADLAGAALAGLLAVEPESSDVLSWTERILGNRSVHRPMRLVGPLLGVTDAQLRTARSWVWPHQWAGLDAISATRSVVGVTAVRALTALVEDPESLPPYDDRDRRAQQLDTTDELVGALKRPARYDAEHVFARLREASDLDATTAGHVGDWLCDALRFAADDPDDPATDRVRHAAIEALLAHVAYATPQLDRLLELDHAGPWREVILNLSR